MVDRFGNPIVIGWSPVEIEWLMAAMTLPHVERMAACRDIAEMSGRSVSAVKNRIYKLQCQWQEIAIARVIKQHRETALPPSQIRPLTPAEMMVRRA